MTTIGGGLSVVLGSGPLGLSVARQLARRGDRVRCVNRSGRAEVPAGVELLAADIFDASEAQRSCQGAAVVYHCANPPYSKWPQLHPPLMKAIINAAAAAEAKLIFGDNLYCYGPVEAPITEDLPYRALGPNGRARARIAEELLQAAVAGAVRAAIGRASDFFGPYVHLSVVGDQIFARALAGKAAQLLGNPDQPHTVTYIEDFGRALITLADDEVALGKVWHVPNPQTTTLRQYVQLVFAEVGGTPRIQVLPRWMLRLIAMVNPTLHAVTEQLYQVDRPWVVDSSRFEEQFGWSATPLQDSIRATVAGLLERARSLNR